jgi:hypothetical protein
MYDTADKLGVPLVRFPAYITELIDRIDVLGKEIDHIEAKKQDALKVLREYNSNKPFLVQIQKLKLQISDMEEKLHNCEHALKMENAGTNI